MLIHAYGLFWREDEIDWNPGTGGGRWELLGRQGKVAPGLRVADFRDQRGIYILYGNYGPHYVGLTIERGLGIRLREHRSDRHTGRWDRFSWFGFRRVLARRSADGISPLADLALGKYVENDVMIREMEAILIHAMGLQNIRQTRFPEARQPWHQIRRDEDHFLDRVLRRRL